MSLWEHSWLGRNVLRVQTVQKPAAAFLLPQTGTKTRLCNRLHLHWNAKDSMNNSSAVTAGHARANGYRSQIQILCQSLRKLQIQRFRPKLEETGWEAEGEESNTCLCCSALIQHKQKTKLRRCLPACRDSHGEAALHCCLLHVSLWGSINCSVKVGRTPPVMASSINTDCLLGLIFMQPASAAAPSVVYCFCHRQSCV